MKLEKLMEIFLNELKDEEEGDLFIQRKKEIFSEAGGGKIEKIQKSEVLEFAIRIYSKGKLGFGYLADPSEKKLLEIIKQVRETLPYQKSREYFCFPEPSALLKVDDIYDPDFDVIPQKKYEDLALIIEREAKEFDKRIVTTRNARVSGTYIEAWIVNSKGVNYRAEKTIFEQEIMVVAEEDGETGDSWGYSWSHYLSDLKDIGSVSAERALKAIGGEVPWTGRYPVIIENRVAAMLLDTLFSGFLFESREKKRTPLLGKDGEKIFGNTISIIVDGTYSGGPFAFPFDGEGVITERRVIVDKGMFRNWIYDCEYANMVSKRPTGSMVRDDLKAPPYLAASNFFVEPSKISFEDAVSEIGNGILITELMGLHTVDPITWQFSLGAKGFEVENGGIGKPLQQFTISGDFLSFFSKARVLNDLFFMGGSGSPSIVVEDIDVAGK